jgi:hypothetical protein
LLIFVRGYLKAGLKFKVFGFTVFFAYGFLCLLFKVVVGFCFCFVGGVIGGGICVNGVALQL